MYVDEFDQHPSSLPMCTPNLSFPLAFITDFCLLEVVLFASTAFFVLLCIIVTGSFLLTERFVLSSVLPNAFVTKTL